MGGGESIDGYELRGEIARGGQGTVFRAWAPQLGREVALKLLAGTASQKAAKRFEREVETLARLEHPNLVQVLGAT